MIESRSAVTVVAEDGPSRTALRPDVLSCANIATRSMGQECAVTGAGSRESEGRYEMTRMGSLEERGAVRRRPDGMEPS